jgi:hypothetical protein
MSPQLFAKTLSTIADSAIGGDVKDEIGGVNVIKIGHYCMGGFSPIRT